MSESLPLAPTKDEVRTVPIDRESSPSSPRTDALAVKALRVKLSLPEPPYKELAVIAPATETRSLPSSTLSKPLVKTSARTTESLPEPPPTVELVTAAAKVRESSPVLPQTLFESQLHLGTGNHFRHQGCCLVRNTTNDDGVIEPSAANKQH